jgi:hypothetical protein
MLHPGTEKIRQNTKDFITSQQVRIQQLEFIKKPKLVQLSFQLL